ncbi:MAG: 3-(cis-5,6-dihydroxycyclohexa-1,3-dien-1-yl)propanoate dehydrogenase [Acidimicrobiia bacterium]
MGWLEGTTALVTGGGSGLGRAIVDRFVREGARVGALDRSADKIAELEADHGESVVGVVGDVTSLEDNERAVATVTETFGRLDTLVANAGIWDYFVSLADMPGDALGNAFDELFAVNVKGYLFGAKASLPALLETRGSMIFTASNASFYVAGGGPLYTASKHAVVGLVRQLAYELAPKIRVNGVAPGAMATDLRGPASLGLENQAISSVEGIDDLIKSLVPLQFTPTPEDYVGHYVTLASRENSKATTGIVISCDGGIGVRGLQQVAGGLEL